MTLSTIPASHPAADLFPPMDADEYAALVESIRAHGQQEPVTLHEGQILDGRHRWRACVELGIEPRTRPWAGECNSPTAFVLVMNLHRRHLSTSQRATVGVDALPLFEGEARLRMLAGKRVEAVIERHRFECTVCHELFDRELAHCERCGAHWPADEHAVCGSCYREPLPLVTTQPIDNPVQRFEQGQADLNARKSVQMAAKATGTNRQYVSDAKAIKDKAPDVFDQVKAGAVTIPEAKREVERREVEQAQATFERAVAADPDAARRLAEKRLSAAYARGWSQFGSSVLMLTPEALAQTFDDNDWVDLDRRAERAATWFSAVKAARPRGLRVVGA